MLACYGSKTIGTGTDADPYRPEIGDTPGVEGWAACYEQPDEKRALVLVKAPAKVLDTLAKSYECTDAKRTALTAQTAVLSEVKRTAKEDDAAYTERVLSVLAKHSVNPSDLRAG